jgi:hypothetical protein
MQEKVAELVESKYMVKDSRLPFFLTHRTVDSNDRFQIQIGSSFDSSDLDSQAVSSWMSFEQIKAVFDSLGQRLAKMEDSSYFRGLEQEFDGSDKHYIYLTTTEASVSDWKELLSMFNKYYLTICAQWDSHTKMINFEKQRKLAKMQEILSSEGHSL